MADMAHSKSARAAESFFFAYFSKPESREIGSGSPRLR